MITDDLVLEDKGENSIDPNDEIISNSFDSIGNFLIKQSNEQVGLQNDLLQEQNSILLDISSNLEIIVEKMEMLDDIIITASGFVVSYGVLYIPLAIIIIMLWWFFRQFLERYR